MLLFGLTYNKVEILANFSIFSVFLFTTAVFALSTYPCTPSERRTTISAENLRRPPRALCARHAGTMAGARVKPKWKRGMRSRLVPLFLHLRTLICFKVERLRLSSNSFYFLFYRPSLPSTYPCTPSGREERFSLQIPSLLRAHAVRGTPRQLLAHRHNRKRKRCYGCT